MHSKMLVVVSFLLAFLINISDAALVRSDTSCSDHFCAHCCDAAGQSGLMALSADRRLLMQVPGIFGPGTGSCGPITIAYGSSGTGSQLQAFVAPTPLPPTAVNIICTPTSSDTYTYTLGPSGLPSYTLAPGTHSPHLMSGCFSPNDVVIWEMDDVCKPARSIYKSGSGLEGS